MEAILEKLGILGLVPIVTIDDAKDAVAVGRALMDGGLPCVEITFRTAAAVESIRLLHDELPEMLIGAGTVLNVEQVREALAAGAEFIISPGLDMNVVHYCIRNNIPIIPGVTTPTEIQTALACGLKIFKFFPAEAMGGLETLKAIAAPFGMLKFIPAGGVNTANLLDYLSFPKVHACGGSWMVKSDLIRDARFEEIARITREAVLTMLGFSLAHVGINTADNEESLAVAKQLSAIFQFALKEGSSSNFAGGAFEVMKGQGRGVGGHIAVRTNSIPRAVAYLERQGVIFDKDAAKEVNGVIQAVFFENEIAGFAVHLVQDQHLA